MATSRQKPATNDSPIKGPTSPAKQPRKNLTNSDPPPVKGNPSREGSSDIVTRPKSKTNPDPNKHITTQTPDVQKPGDIISRADIQYVPSSIAVNRYIRGDLILPSTIDEAELKTQLGIYDAMLEDPTIAGVRLWMNTNILADGLSYEPREIEPDYGQEEPNDKDMLEADWSRRYVVAAIQRLSYTDRSIMLTLWDLLEGARIPHKIAEATFDTMKSGDYAGMPGIKFLKCKPRINYNLVYDTMNTFRGIVAVVPGQSLAKWSGFIFDVSVLPNAIAAEKLLLFYLDDRDGIPKSLYNAAFAPWNRMLDLYADMMSTANASAGGKIAIVLGEKASQQYTDPVTGILVTAEEQARSQGSKWGNEGVLVLMHGATPYVFFPPPGALDAFIEGIKMCKREIWTALTTNDKTGMEGEHGSGLSQDNSADAAQPVIELGKSRLCMCMDKLSYNLLKLAKGEEYARRYCPSATMKRGDVVDFPASGTAWAAIASAEGFTPSQVPDFCKLIGVKAPTAAELQVMGETWNKQQDLKANPPEPVIAGPKPAAKPTSKKT